MLCKEFSLMLEREMNIYDKNILYRTIISYYPPREEWLDSLQVKPGATTLEQQTLDLVEQARQG